MKVRISGWFKWSNGESLCKGKYREKVSAVDDEGE